MQLQPQRTNSTKNKTRASGAGEPAEVTVGAWFMQLDKEIAGQIHCHGLSAVCKYSQEGNAEEWDLLGLKDMTSKRK